MVRWKQLESGKISDKLCERNKKIYIAKKKIIISSSVKNLNNYKKMQRINSYK